MTWHQRKRTLNGTGATASALWNRISTAIARETSQLPVARRIGYSLFLCGNTPADWFAGRGQVIDLANVQLLVRTSELRLSSIHHSIGDPIPARLRKVLVWVGISRAWKINHGT